jgi:protein gp37
MGENTTIEWTATVLDDGTVLKGFTYNPWWGCQRVSPGCGGAKGVGGCYAEALAKRYGYDLWGPTAPRRFFGDAHWNAPFKWNRAAEAAGVRRKVFCASMADILEDRRGLDEPRARLFGTIERTPWLDWLLLTKRPENYLRMLPPAWLAKPLPSVWVGCTTEDQQRLEERAAHLRAVPAAVRFFSAEPLLSDLDFGLDRDATTNRFGVLSCDRCRGWGVVRAPGYDDEGFAREAACTSCNGTGSAISWVIGGAESGPGARPMARDWIRHLRDQCAEACVPFLYKQDAEKGRKVSLPLLDGVQHAAFPEVSRG